MGSAADLAVDAGRALSEGAGKDPRGLWRFLTIVGCAAILGGTVYLLATRSDVADRYTGSDASRDWKAAAEQRAADLKSQADQRSADLAAQAAVNRAQGEALVRMSTVLDGVDRRTTRIEAKLDAK